jgi:Ca2+-binding EF-hand superfamily protein
MTKLTLASAFLLVAAGCSEEENPVKKAYHAHHGEHVAAVDLDGDGTVDKDEMLVHHQDMFDSLDTDGDGKLSAAEAAKGPGRLAEHFAMIDTDGDGFVTEAEIAAAIARFHGDHHAE